MYIVDHIWCLFLDKPDSNKIENKKTKKQNKSVVRVWQFFLQAILGQNNSVFTSIDIMRYMPIEYSNDVDIFV